MPVTLASWPEARLEGPTREPPKDSFQDHETAETLKKALAAAGGRVGI